MNFLSDTEKREALQSIVEMVTDDSFDVTHIDVLRPNRKRPGSVLMGDRQKVNVFDDSGVRIITIVGTVPIEPPSTALTESEDADLLAFALVDDDEEDATV